MAEAATATTESAELAAFRVKVRGWLDENLPAYAGRELESSRQFRSALWDAGLLGITLDPAYGGQGLGHDHQRVFAEEARGRKMPPIGEAVTTGICAPTLLDFGSEEQKKRHIPRMIRG